MRGKEHWWWDTAADNDGGCVFDAAVRQWIEKVRARGLRPADEVRLSRLGVSESRQPSRSSELYRVVEFENLECRHSFDFAKL